MHFKFPQNNSEFLFKIENLFLMQNRKAFNKHYSILNTMEKQI